MSSILGQSRGDWKRTTVAKVKTQKSQTFHYLENLALSL